MTYEELVKNYRIEIVTEQRLAECEPFSYDNEDLDDFFSNSTITFSEYLLGKTYQFLIVDAYNTPNTIHFYQKNGFRFLIEDEKLEAKYMGIGVDRLPLHTRLMYYDLIEMKLRHSI